MQWSTLCRFRLTQLQLALSLALLGPGTGRALADAIADAPTIAPNNCTEQPIPRSIGARGDIENTTPLRLSAFACAKALQASTTPISPYEGPLSLKIAPSILRSPPISPAAITGEPTPLLVALTLNQVARGDFALLAMPDGDYWLNAADAVTLGLAAPNSTNRDYRGEKYLSLKAIGAGKFTFSERELTLSLELPPAVFARQRVDTGVQPSIRQLSGNDEFSSILNYQTAISGTQGSGTKPVAQLTTELATRWQGVLFRHSSAYFGGDTPLRYARYETQAIYDDPANLRRWTFGDTVSYSGTFGSTLPIAGISVTKFYGFDPRFIRFPLAGFSTFASTPSELTVSYQGIPMLQKQVQPGPVDIRNLYYYGGARTLDVTIRDSLGRVQSFKVPFYFTDEVLGKGVDEYSYQLGKLRNNPGGEFDHYERTAALAFYRKGLTDFFTLGARGEASSSVANGGVLAALRGDSWGIVSGNLSYGGSRGQSTSGGRYATASQAAYAYQTREAGIRISLSRNGDAYQTLGDGRGTLLTSGSRIIRELRASASYNIAGLGLFAVDISRRRNAAGDNIIQRGLSFSKSLGHGLVAFLNVNDASGSTNKREVFFNLNWNLDVNYNASATVRSSNVDGESYSTSFNKSIPNGPGIGYRIDTDSLRNGDASGNRVRAFSQWNADMAQLRGEVSADRFGQSSTTRSYSADVSGAISLAGNRWALSRPIADSFALVALAEPLEGIKVFQNNQLAGVTDSEGKLLLPALNAFQDNQIMLDHHDFPLDYSFGKLNKSLYPPFRSGQYWQVDVYLSQTFGGSLRARIDGQMRIVPPGTGSLLVNGKPTSFLIGNNGEFFLERMVPGQYTGEIFIDSRNCNFKLTVPVTKESYVKLGQIVACE